MEISKNITIKLIWISRFARIWMEDKEGEYEEKECEELVGSHRSFAMSSGRKRKDIFDTCRFG